MSKPEKKVLVPALRFPEFQNTGGWKKTRLGKIGEFIGGGTPETSVAEYWDGDIQWFTPSEVKEKHLSKSKRTITEKGLKNSSAKLLPKGTLLLSTRATVGDVGIATIPCSTNQGFQSLLVNESETNIFWYYWLVHHKNELVRKSSGSTFLEIGKNEIQKVEALRPTVNEQQKIADCLSSIDYLITAQTQKLAALKAHKKGLMQQLFPAEGETVPRLRFPEFRDGGEWKSQKLEGLTKRGSGHTPNKAKPSYYNGGVKWVSLADSNKLDNGYIYDTKVEISDDGLKNSSAVLHTSGTVIISRDAGVGKSAVMHSNMAVSQHFIVWTCDPAKLINWFLYYTLQNLKPTFESIAVGSTIKTIGLPYFKELCISTPSVEEQQKIADCLSSIGELITAQSQKIEALKLHKKGLMQQLFPALDNHPTPSGHPSTGGELRQHHSPPVEGWQAQPDGVVSPTAEDS